MHPICNTICYNIPDRPANAADTRQKIACRFVVFATNKQLACSRPLNRPTKLSEHTNRLHCEPMPQTEPVARLYVNRTRRFVAFKKQQHVMKASKYWYNTLVCAPRYLSVRLPYNIQKAYGGTCVYILWVEVDTPRYPGVQLQYYIP